MRYKDLKKNYMHYRWDILFKWKRTLESKDISVLSLQKQILQIHRALFHYFPNLIYEMTNNHDYY